GDPAGPMHDDAVDVGFDIVLVDLHEVAQATAGPGGFAATHGHAHHRALLREQYLIAFRGEVARGDAAGRTGADHDDVVGGGLNGHRRKASWEAARMPPCRPGGPSLYALFFSMASAPTGQKRTQIVQ